MVETTNKGYVCQIIGPVLDIEFPDGNLPLIYSAIKIETADESEILLKFNNY